MNYRLKIIEELGGQCMYVDQETGLGCSMRWDGQPIDNVDMLHVEHVNGGGSKQRAKYSKGYLGNLFAGQFSSNQQGASYDAQNYYKDILDNLHTGNYQLLCANHHALKTAMERRARKQAQALAKEIVTPVSDLQHYENNKETSTIVTCSGSDRNDHCYRKFVNNLYPQYSFYISGRKGLYSIEPSGSIKEQV